MVNQCDPLLQTLGTTVPELVISFSDGYQNKRIIEKLIEESSKQRGASKETLVQEIFAHEKDGRNCLHVSFKMMQEYYKQTGQIPDRSFEAFNSFEEYFLYLLELAERNNVGMNRVINVTDKTGISIFYLATFFSEIVSNALINLNVIVNRIDNQFITPVFRVR